MRPRFRIGLASSPDIAGRGFPRLQRYLAQGCRLTVLTMPSGRQDFRDVSLSDIGRDSFAAVSSDASMALAV
jgi:hypothetical protein